MLLNSFSQKYDTENSIVLLEGKRNVLETDRPKLIELGKLLAINTSRMIFNKSAIGRRFCSYDSTQ